MLDSDDVCALVFAYPADKPPLIPMLLAMDSVIEFATAFVTDSPCMAAPAAESAEPTNGAIPARGGKTAAAASMTKGLLKLWPIADKAPPALLAAVGLV